MKAVLLQGRDVAVFVDLRRWASEDYQIMKRITDPRARVEVLLRKYSAPATSAAELDQLPLSVRRLVIVDGLNEIASGVAQQILFAIDEYIQVSPVTSVIAGDRVVRRDFIRPGEWKHATILPLDPEAARKLLASRSGTARVYDEASERERSLLRFPFFLNLAIRAKSSDPTQFFLDVCRLSRDELAAAARAAFIAYRDFRSRTFDLAEFEREAGASATSKLVRGGVLSQSGGRASFQHHLFHDYLVAWFLSDSREKWSYDNLSAATFKSSSFDVLAMTAEFVERPGDVDDFVRRVYDWNPYGAAYVLAAAHTAATPNLTLQLMSLLAEKRFDVMKRSAQRAEDGLRLLGSKAESFLGARQLDDVLAGVTLLHGDEAFEAWKHVFLIDADIREIVVKLEDIDSVLGWTAANALKRAALADDEQGRIRDLLLNGAAASVVRWRAAHVLGAFPSRPNVDGLLRVLRGEAPVQVRYGALRSLIEIAARAPGDLRELVLVTVEAVVGNVEPELKNEFASAIQIRRPPPGWANLVTAILGKLSEDEKSLEKRDEYARLAVAVRSEIEVDQR